MGAFIVKQTNHAGHTFAFTSACMVGRNKKCARRRIFTNLLAEWTGLEPATPGVTGRYSNQLNYHSW